MHGMTLLLLKERGRRLRHGRGWMGWLSAGSALGLLAWSAGALLPLRPLPPARWEELTAAAWTSWLLVAAVTGRDFSWRVGRDRLRVFPARRFGDLYVHTFALGFLSLPILAGLGLALRRTARAPNPALAAATAAAGYLLFVASVRLGASLLRNTTGRFGALRHGERAAAAVTLSLAAAAILGEHLAPGSFPPHPGRLFGRALASPDSVLPPALMLVWVALLGGADFLVERRLHYSALPRAHAAGERAPLPHPAWPGPLFWIGVSGWLRYRGALMLAAWGGGFSFCWTWFTGSLDAGYFFSFTFLNLFFHSYLRANLFGIDRDGAWIHYRFPVGAERALGARSLSLDFLQGGMIACLFAAGALKGGAGIGPSDWARILSYALSGILFGEICGWYFTVRRPESIDRTSQFDGGATIGALVVGLLQLGFLLLFLAASSLAARALPPLPGAAIWAAPPLGLAAVRAALLRGWVRRALAGDVDNFLKRLAWF